MPERKFGGGLRLHSGREVLSRRRGRCPLRPDGCRERGSGRVKCLQRAGLAEGEEEADVDRGHDHQRARETLVLQREERTEERGSIPRSSPTSRRAGSLPACGILAQQPVDDTARVRFLGRLDLGGAAGTTACRRGDHLRPRRRGGIRQGFPTAPWSPPRRAGAAVESGQVEQVPAGRNPRAVRARRRPRVWARWPAARPAERSAAGRPDAWTEPSGGPAAAAAEGPGSLTRGDSAGVADPLLPGDAGTSAAAGRAFVFTSRVGSRCQAVS